MSTSPPPILRVTRSIDAILDVFGSRCRWQPPLPDASNRRARVAPACHQNASTAGEGYDIRATLIRPALSWRAAALLYASSSQAPVTRASADDSTRFRAVAIGACSLSTATGESGCSRDAAHCPCIRLHPCHRKSFDFLAIRRGSENSSSAGPRFKSARRLQQPSTIRHVTRSPSCLRFAVTRRSTEPDGCVHCCALHMVPSIHRMRS
jgi:hypothetical protein